MDKLQPRTLVALAGVMLSLTARADTEAVRYVYKALDQAFSTRSVKTLPLFFTPNFKMRLQGGRNGQGMMQVREWQAFLSQSKGTSCTTTIKSIRTVGNKVYAQADRRIRHKLIEPRGKKVIEMGDRWQTNDIFILFEGKWRLDEMEIVKREKWANGKRLGAK